MVPCSATRERTSHRSASCQFTERKVCAELCSMSRWSALLAARSGPFARATDPPWTVATAGLAWGAILGPWTLLLMGGAPATAQIRPPFADAQAGPPTPDPAPPPH